MLRDVASAGFVIIGAVSSGAQSFEVASIKAAAPMTPWRIIVSMSVGMSGGPGTPDPEHMTWTNVSLKDLIQSAWDVKAYQVSGPTGSSRRGSISRRKCLMERRRSNRG